MKKSSLLLLLSLFAFKAEAQTDHTFYGIEIKRCDDVAEAFDFLQNNRSAKYFIWKSNDILVDSDDYIVLTDYFSGLADAEKALKKFDSGKVIEFRVSSKLVSPGNGLVIYQIPLVASQDSLAGDIWVKTKNNVLTPVERDILLGYAAAERTDIFKFIGFSESEDSFLYCVDNCSLYDIKTHQKTEYKEETDKPLTLIGEQVYAAVNQDPNLKMCRDKMDYEVMHYYDNWGYYRGVCEAKEKKPVFEARLRFESDKWKIFQSAWGY